MKRGKFCLFLLLLFLINTNEAYTQSNVSVTVFVDKTDTTNFKNFQTQHGKDFATRVFKFYDFKAYAKGTFRVGVINDISVNAFKEHDYIVAPDLHPSRIEEVTAEFIKGSIVKLREVSKDKDVPKDSSLIFQPICRELARLKQRPYTRKVIILYSDMLEHSRLFSFYEPKLGAMNTEKEYEDTYKKIISRSQDTLSEVRNLEVYVVNQRTAKSDQNFIKAEKLWAYFFLQKVKAKKFVFSSNIEID